MEQGDDVERERAPSLVFGLCPAASQEGDVLVSNHPQLAGGSHLPDITVVTPVFNQGTIVFFVASRGHHAGQHRGGVMAGQWLHLCAGQALGRAQRVAGLQQNPGAFTGNCTMLANGLLLSASASLTAHSAPPCDPTPNASTYPKPPRPAVQTLAASPRAACRPTHMPWWRRGRPSSLSSWCKAAGAGVGKEAFVQSRQFWAACQLLGRLPGPHSLVPWKLATGTASAMVQMLACCSVALSSTASSQAASLICVLRALRPAGLMRRA